MPLSSLDLVHFPNKHCVWRRNVSWSSSSSFVEPSTLKKHFYHSPRRARGLDQSARRHESKYLGQTTSTPQTKTNTNYRFGCISRTNRTTIINIISVLPWPFCVLAATPASSSEPIMSAFTVPPSLSQRGPWPASGGPPRV